MKASLACLQLIKTTVALDAKAYSFTHALLVVHFVTFITGLDIAVYEREPQWETHSSQDKKYSAPTQISVCLKGYFLYFD